MTLQRLRTIALGLLVAFTAIAWMAPAEAEARSPRAHRQKVQPWHGWANDGFYLSGVRYPGGNRRGPAFAYNNYEGGFNPTAYWQIMAMQTG
jgi:hypothetical protein